MSIARVSEILGMSPEELEREGGSKVLPAEGAEEGEGRNRGYDVQVRCEEHRGARRKDRER